MRTLADLHERLRAYIGNDGSQERSAAVVRAAMEAIQILPTKHDWNYYKSIFRINTSPSQADGTIEFDLTGGAEERLVTLTGSTWPSWATYGTLVVAGVPYDVDQRLSATQITLKSSTSPSADIAAGTSYVFYRQRYDLPEDFASMVKPIQAGNNLQYCWFKLEEYIARRNWNDAPAQPILFTLSNDGFGRQQLLLWPAADAVYPIEFQYRRNMIVPSLTDYYTGRITLTDGSTTVTGNNTTFNASMNDSILRVSYDGNKPSAPDGNNPPQYEYLVKTADSGTQLTLRSAATATVTNRGYLLSGRLDIEPGPMFHYLCHLAMRLLRIGLRINLIGGEAEEYKAAKDAAKGFDGQRYAGSDPAGMSTSWQPQYRSPMRTVQ